MNSFNYKLADVLININQVGQTHQRNHSAFRAEKSMISKTKSSSARWIIKGTGSNSEKFESVPLIIP
jgi:hypothetical protein